MSGCKIWTPGSQSCGGKSEAWTSSYGLEFLGNVSKLYKQYQNHGAEYWTRTNAEILNHFRGSLRVSYYLDILHV